MIEALREFHRRTGASHFASSASVLPVLLAVKRKMRAGDPMQPGDGDVCLLGKAHAITAYNLVFGIPMEGPPTQGEFGSLGSALPFALGIAKMRPRSSVYVVCGDGEMQEGSCSEAMMAARRLGIRNIEVHVDRNGMQGMGQVLVPGFPVIFYHDTVKGTDWTCHYANA